MKRLLLILLSLWLCCAQASAAIARVQSKTANSAAGSVATLDVVLDSAPTAGNIVVLVASSVSATASIAVTQTSGISWQYHTSQGGSSTALLVAVGRVFASASATITVTSGTAGGMAIAAAEYSGTQGRVDRIAAATSTGTSAASGATATTATAKELWIGGIAHRLSGGTTFSSATNGFSIVGQDKSGLATGNDRSVALLEKIVSATGTADAGVTASGSGVWVAEAMTLEETPAAGGGTSAFTFAQ